MQVNFFSFFTEFDPHLTSGSLEPLHRRLQPRHLLIQIYDPELGFSNPRLGLPKLYHHGGNAIQNALALLLKLQPLLRDRQLGPQSIE